MAAAPALAGKVALVTGASRGIGKACALALAEAGADVVCAATTAANAEPVAEQVRALGRRALAAAAEVQDAAQVGALFDAAEGALGGVDILVNNAGISVPQLILEMDETTWDRVVDTNLKGVFLCAQRAARGMQARGAGGAIVNIGSLAGENAFPMRANYCASKAGVHHLTRVMAIEWARLGIRVNCVAPGYVLTELVQELHAQGRLQISALEARTPQGRLGTPRDIADAVVYLAGDGAAYVTGSVLLVDGGWHAYGHV
jgi:NAD(P)-dependent dehydrogenase (short-subunit alcohol dehydrogenase family)